MRTGTEPTGHNGPDESPPGRPPTELDRAPAGEPAQGQAAELAREQAYFDAAATHRARKWETLAGIANAAANTGAAAQLKRYAKETAATTGGGDSPVAFGRIDPADGKPLYIGPGLITDDRQEPLVINWRTPAAEPYYQASPGDPHGLRRKRTFTCQANTIKDFTDVVFAVLADPVAQAPTDQTPADQTPAGQASVDRAPVDRALLADLARSRDGTMRDIVATIQAAQYEVIRAPLDRLLILAGGPGTGKTAVALHRVSWLLFHHRERLPATQVLVIGPHPTFMNYIGQVLPGLGDEVAMRDLGRLAPAVPRGRAEPAAVVRLKGDPRLAGLLARALANRVGSAEPTERVLVRGRLVTLPGSEVAAARDAARQTGLPYAEARSWLRTRLVALATERAGAEAGVREAVDGLLGRLWPAQSPAAFLRDLLGSRSRLRAAATSELTGDQLTDDELDLLHRRGADRLSEEIWSDADLPLLDELDHLINGGGDTFRHIMVDEAQDLSPMQLRSVARRSATGSLTVVGDLAQSTGAWARDSWDEVTAHLPAAPVQLAPLRYGYRVPRQAYELAARLLPVAAPEVVGPEVVRVGPAEPRLHQVGLAERAGRVATVAAGHAAADRFVGVVCPLRCRREVEAALAANGIGWSSAAQGELGAAVNLVSPHEAKGLEFDAVVVVEPEQIVAGDPRGHRLLYIALTRTTGHLDVVSTGDPLPLAPVPAQPDHPPAPSEGGFTSQDIGRLADHLADRLRSAAPPAAWPAVLAELTRRLDEAGRR